MTVRVSSTVGDLVRLGLLGNLRDCWHLGRLGRHAGCPVLGLLLLLLLLLLTLKGSVWLEYRILELVTWLPSYLVTRLKNLVTRLKNLATRLAGYQVSKLLTYGLVMKFE